MKQHSQETPSCRRQRTPLAATGGSQITNTLHACEHQYSSDEASVNISVGPKSTFGKQKNDLIYGKVFATPGK